MTGSAIAIASAFLFLSPAKTAPFKPFENADRSTLERAYDAGEKPLVFSSDDVFTLTNQADVISAAVLTKLPTPNLIHTWKSLDVKLLYSVEYTPEGSAEYFRRSCAFLPFYNGADGVFIRNPTKLPDAWKAALKEAIVDAEVLSYLRTLRDKALASTDPMTRTEARRVTYWFGYMPVEWENLDCLRLECVAYAKRLEQFLHVTPRDLPTSYNPPPTPDVVPSRPFSELATPPPQINLKAFDNDKVSLLDDGSDAFTFSSSRTGFSISFAFPGGPVLGKNEVVKGAGKFTVSLYIPSPTVKGDFLPYHFEIDPNDFRVGPRARTPSLWKFLWSMEERFTQYSTGYGLGHQRYYYRPQRRTFSPDYPKLSPSYSYASLEKGGWRVTLNFSWLDLYGFWPSTHNNQIDVWFVSIDRLPNGTHPSPRRLAWARGREVHFNFLADKISLGYLTTLYKEQLARTVTVWNTSYGERLYRFDKTPTPTYHRYDLESDEIFRTRVMDPVVNANANIWKLVQNDKEHPKPGFNNQPENIRREILKSLAKLIYLSNNVGLLRRDYIRDRYAGIIPPEPEKPKEEKTLKSENDFIDDPGYTPIELDDVTF